MSTMQLGNFPKTTARFREYFTPWAVNYKKRSMVTTLAHLASENLDSVVENGIPALKLTNIPSKSVIPNYFARFFQGKFGADQDGVDSDIGTDEEIYQVIRNAEEHC